MQEIKLNVAKREGVGKGVARKVRRAGFIPGILYGPEVEPLPVSVNTRELAALLRRFGHATKLIDMNLEGEGNARKVLIRELQTDPVTGEYLHVDLYQVSMSKKLYISTPVYLTGTPAGVKLGGILEHVTREIEISCLPADIPERIEIDVSGLEIGESVHVKDIKLERVDILTDLHQTIATVVPPTVIKTAAETAAEEAKAAEEAEAAEAEAKPAAKGG